MRDIVAGKVRPSADSDVAERAQHHLKRAIEFAPFASGPLMELSALEAVLAERSGDADQRADHYKKAQDLLKQVLALEPGKAGMYFRLASLERDEFGPASSRQRRGSALITVRFRIVNSVIRCSSNMAASSKTQFKTGRRLRRWRPTLKTIASYVAIVA